jgi:hypothetical protein
MSLRTGTLPGFGIAAADVPPAGGILLGAAEAGRCTGMTWLPHLEMEKKWGKNPHDDSFYLTIVTIFHDIPKNGC